MKKNLLWRTAVRRGVLGGSQRWFQVAAVLGVVKLVRRLGGDGPKVLYSEKITEGTTLVISTLPPSAKMGE